MKSKSYLGLLALLVALLALGRDGVTAEQDPAARPSAVRISEEPMVIPTYQAGSPDPNPMFYTHESYQGAQKRIYPYALQDQLTHVRENKTYKALRLENEYLQICVLPELGGRLFSATDKTNGYDFFYRQHVIKPALIGMLGAWISGGVEWCAFHHHRNTTFMPVDYTLVENPDGSKTIWFGEIERRHRMKWLIGLTLFPDKSYVEATVKFFNRSPQPHSILNWANVAVHVNDQYQVIFPPSVQVATYHSKIDFTNWPIAQGKYRGHDYTGLDISWWKNSPPNNSFFAWQLQEDFMGGYDHGKQAGVVHVGDHHVVCGAKLWEWGTGPAGRLWDKILSDEDGPYAELMVGAWSDNQPDYSWIKPGEVKEFKQYWYPIRAIGGFKNANRNGAVNLELRPNNLAAIGFHTTSKHAGAKAILKAGDKTIFEQVIAIGPEKPFTCEMAVPAGTKATDLRAALVSAKGKELVAYQPVQRKPVTELPKTVQPPPKPQDIKNAEELFLTGLRVEQIHNPTVDPTEYYQEAVKRDPGDSRANTQLGIHYNKRGMYAQAEAHLRKAIERLSADYTRPIGTEAYYQLGIALRGQGRADEAYDAFFRATWDNAFHSAGFQQLAELSCRKGQYAQALGQINNSLSTGCLNTKAGSLCAAIVRRLGHVEQGLEVAKGVLAADPLDFGAMNERYLAVLALGAQEDATALRAAMEQKMRGEVQAYLELATDYLGAGMWDEAIAVLRRPVDAKMAAGNYPMVHYLLGYLYEQKGDKAGAAASYARAATMPADYCFPFRAEEADALNAALKANPSDARACYYLGNLLFDLQPEKAVACWEKSRAIDDRFATVHRNLGWAWFRVKNDIGKAIECYERAIACQEPDPRLFVELDSLYEFGNLAPERRLAALEKNHAIVAKRQDSFQREIAVLVISGKYDQAIGYLAKNFFHAKEGSEGIHDVYVDAHLLRGLEQMKEKKFAEALGHFQKAAEYPENLSVGRPENDPRAAQVSYLTGTAFDAMGEKEKAKECYTKAAAQRGTRDWPDARYYQALSQEKLGRKDEAAKTYDELIRTGTDRLARESSTDFFAKFGEQETRKAQAATAHYLLGLGRLGKGERDQSRQEFEQAVKMNLSHTWARQALLDLGP